MIKKNKKVWNYYSILGLALILSLIVFYLNRPVPGPMIQADEGSYFANAAAITGFHNDMGNSYRAGYSFLIAPAFWLASSPQAVWSIIQIINAFLFFSLVLTLWWCAGLLDKNISIKRRLFSVALVSLYPMWVIMAGYGFSQIAFVAFHLVTFGVFLKALDGKTAWWIILGFLSGFLYWIHPTGITSIIAVFVASIYFSFNKKSYTPLLFLLPGIIIMPLVYRYGINPWLLGRTTISGLIPNLHYPDPLKLLTPFLSINGIVNIIARTGGHIFYLTIGTVGLVWIGIFTIIKQLFYNQTASPEDIAYKKRSIALFLLLPLAGCLAISVLFFSSMPISEIRSLDHWMYGRYTEGVLAPILLIGAISGSLRKGIWAIPIAVLCMCLLMIGLNDYSPAGRPNVPALWQDFLLHKESLWIWLAASCILIFIVVKIPYRYGLSIIMAVFCVSSFLQIKWHIAAYNNELPRWNAALAVRKHFPPGTSVGFDHSGIDSYTKHVFWFDYAFVLYDYKMKRMSYEQWLKSCDGPLFTYDKTLSEKNDNIYMIAGSSLGGPTAWIKGTSSEVNISDKSAKVIQTKEDNINSQKELQK